MAVQSHQGPFPKPLRGFPRGPTGEPGSRIASHSVLCQQLARLRERALARVAALRSSSRGIEVVKDRTHADKGKSWAKVLPADRRGENEKAPFPGLFQ